jgi:hypothetical protein
MRLTGEAHVGRRADRAQPAQLGLARQRQRRLVADHHHPAGRAAAATAAHRHVRDAVHAAHLEQRRPFGGLAEWAADILHGDAHRPPLLHRARDAEQDRQCGDRIEADRRIGAPSDDPRLRRGVGPVGGSLEGGEGGGVGGAQRHLAALRDDAEHSRERQQRRGDEQVGADPAIAARQAQPVVQAEAAVHPDEEQQHRLLDHDVGPDLAQLVGIGRSTLISTPSRAGLRIDAEGEVRDARVDDVRQEQERDRQPGASCSRSHAGKRKVRRWAILASAAPAWTIKAAASSAVPTVERVIAVRQRSNSTIACRLNRPSA